MVVVFSLNISKIENQIRFRIFYMVEFGFYEWFYNILGLLGGLYKGFYNVFMWK